MTFKVACSLESRESVRADDGDKERKSRHRHFKVESGILNIFSTVVFRHVK